MTGMETQRITDYKKQRLKWIDIAKGIAIITVIIGHTAEHGGILRNL